MTTRKIAVVVGSLFFVQMITAAIGYGFIEAFTTGEAGKAMLYGGVLLMTLSAAAVVGIGTLMYQVLKSFNQKLARWYPIMRWVEFSVSAVCSIVLLATLQAVPHHMLWIYIPTGIGGLIFTYLLLTSRIVPQWMAALGFVGYSLLLVSVPLGISGLVDMNAGLGMALMLAPGGLFEFVILPIYLIAKGFRSVQPAAVRV